MKKVIILFLSLMLFASCSKKSSDSVEGKIFYIDAYRSFAFTDCGIVSTVDLSDSGKETLGIYEINNDRIECEFTGGDWEDFTYNKKNNEIVSQGGNIAASGQVFEFSKKIDTKAPFVKKQFEASVSPAYYTWKFYDCGIAKTVMASEGYGETNFGVYYYDESENTIYTVNNEYKYNAEKQRLNTFDTSVNELENEKTPVTGRTFTSLGNDDAKVIFTECGIMALIKDNDVTFYDYSYADNEITYIPFNTTMSGNECGKLVYDEKTDTITPVIQMPDVPYTRDLKLQKTRMNGDDVKQLQEKLIYLGYLQDGENDGYFGPKTENALRSWQRDNGFTVDGIMTQAVFNKLFGL